jgi:hypothetical protein
MAIKIEQRYLSGVELRAADDDSFRISGIAAAYNVKSRDLGGFVEMIAPGAFARALKEQADVKCTVNHDPSRILGRSKSGTLILSDTRAGLFFDCQLDPSQQLHNDTFSAIKRGDLDSCSFAFCVRDGGEKWSETDGLRLRTLTDVELIDVAPVCYPAYPEGTSVSARAFDYRIVERRAAPGSADQIEAAAREALRRRAWLVSLR